MSIPSVYINLEDDVSKVIERLKRVQADKVILVCPRRCFLFSDSINLRLLKKQTDLLGKEVYILTMDERGQLYATEAGFGLKFLPKGPVRSSFSDIRSNSTQKQVSATPAQPEPESVVPAQKPVVRKEPASVLPPVRRVAKPAVSPGVIQNKSAQSIPKVQVRDTVFPVEIDKQYAEKKRVKSWRRLITAFVAACLIVILVVVFVVLPKAAVTVYPKTQPVTRDMTIAVAVQTTTVDASKLALPAAKIDETVEVSNKFQSQGKKEVGNKATGTVRIYNFTRAPLNLKASTTTLTLGSKTYALMNDALGIKPTTYKNAVTKEIDPASLSDPVEVVAVDGGDSFNVPGGTRIEVANQVFGSKPLFLYAKTETPITGGTTRFLSVISPQDITAAQASLADAAIKNVNDKIAANDQALIEKTYTLQPVSFTTDSPAGTQTPSFNATLKVRILGLALKRGDLTQLVSDRIGQSLPANTVLVIKKDEQISFQAQAVDVNAGTATISVHFEGNIVSKINLGNIASDLAGKTKNQGNDILRTRADVDQIDIAISPSWQSSFPWFANKIKVTVIQPQ